MLIAHRSPLTRLHPMLQRLTIRDFVIVEHLELEFGAGFTVLTGETGAGKSILVDALLLAGERPEAAGRTFNIVDPEPVTQAAYLARAAVATGVDGIFLEVHPDPSCALCDGPNSLYMDSLPDLLEMLKKIDRIVKNGER